MDTKLEARGQFPASFPDTFKNFFAMMNEDEDHMGLFANLLEDKVIPRQNSPVPVQRQRYGGSMRSHSGGDSSGRPGRHHYHPPQQQQQQQLPQGQQQHNMSVYQSRSRSGSGGSSSDLVSANIGSRPNSLRRSRASLSFSTNGLNAAGMGPDPGPGNGSGLDLSQCQNTNQNHGQKMKSGSSTQLCKHIKYCCLHQEPLSQPTQPSQADPGQKHVTLVCDCERLREKQKRMGPDGEDNCGVIKLQGYVYGYAPPPALPIKPTKPSKSIKILPSASTTTSSDEPRSSSPSTTAAAKNKSLQERQERTQARHSVILERAFDFDASCDESDSLSLSSSTQGPVPSPAPHQLAYNVLKPILKQPQKQQQQQPLKQQQQQQQPLQQIPAHPKQHRILPTPPTHSGLGAYHTREAALQRVQQQSGFGSRANLTAIPATSTNYGQGPSTSAAAAAAYNAYSQALDQSLQQLQQVQFEAQQPQVQFDSQHVQFEPQQVQFDAHQQQVQFENHQQGYGVEEQQFLEQQQHQLHHQQQFPPEEWEYSTDSNPTTVPTLSTYNDFLNAAQNPTGSRQSLKAQKSPILNRRRASSIAGNLLHSEYNYGTRNSIGGVPLDPEDFQRISHSSSARDRMSLAGVLTFQQAISGAVSPQYGPIGLDAADMLPGRGGGGALGSGAGERGGGGGLVGGLGNGSGGLPGGSAHNLSVGVGLGFLGGSSSTLAAVAEVTSGPDATSSDSLSPVMAIPGQCNTTKSTQTQLQQQQQQQQQRERGVGVGESFGGGSASNSNMASLATANVVATSSSQPGRTLLERQRLRTSSMPAESRRPRLADMRRSAIHTGDPDMGYYRLRSFSITSHGVCNLGDSLRSRRSRSIKSVTSTGTSTSGLDRHNSNASRASGEVVDGGDPMMLGERPPDGDPNVPAFKIAMLGASGVGKTTLTYQFTTSDYICAYDLSLDDDYGQKKVSVLLDNIETDLEIIDHPASEMSTEAFCATYNIDLFVVVYSVVDRKTFKEAERVLQYLKENEMLLSRGAILVGNKTDLERHRVVNQYMGRYVATQIACKFIETSSGLHHNVDELLVGIVAQVKLNPQRLRRLTEKELYELLNLQSAIQKHSGMHLHARRMVRQMSIYQGDEEEEDDDDQEEDEKQEENI